MDLSLQSTELLEALGYQDFFKAQFEKYEQAGYNPARVIKQHKGQFRVRMAQGDYDAKVSGKFTFQATVKKDYPTVGDWVAVKQIDDRQVLIGAVLTRKSYFARKLAISGGRKMRDGIMVGGNIEEQIIGSNIDIAFIVSGLDGNFNIGRLERFITLVLASGAKPVILLNKCDLCPMAERQGIAQEIEAVSSGIAVHFISALEKTNLEAVKSYLTLGSTLVFLGSSGVGKSTIINDLLSFSSESNAIKTSAVSNANGKGRHTTTGAQLIQHPSGCSVIDTPGIRELQLWGDESVLSESFSDVHALLGQCHYSDCSHIHEKGCAIKAAIEEGTLSQERFHRFYGQFNELHALTEKRKEYDDRRLKRIHKARK